MQPVKTVSCPRCGKLARFTAENKWRPFCSERCKMIDLGLWGSESYRVPEQKNDKPGSDPDSSPKSSSP